MEDGEGPGRRNKCDSVGMVETANCSTIMLPALEEEEEVEEEEVDELAAVESDAH